MSDKVPGVFYPSYRFSNCGNSENGYGVGGFSISGMLPDGRHMDIGEIMFQNARIDTYNKLDEKVKADSIGDHLMHRSSIDRRLSKKQAARLTSEIVRHLNKITAEGIPHDVDLPTNFTVPA